jgi:hypothetical protein
MSGEPRVVPNGYPKMGNHALVKALQLLGEPCEVAHIPYGQPLPPGQHILVVRDPRNALISWIRFQGKPVTPGMVVSTFRHVEDASYHDALARYEGWLTDPDTMVVRFEHLIVSDAEMRRIATALGISYLDGAFEALPGLTHTWTGQLSDYRTIWSLDLEARWQAEGGSDILRVWGYEPWNS